MQVNLFTCSEEDLKTLRGVGEKTAREVLSLVQTATAEQRDISLGELQQINKNVQWQELIANGQLVITRPQPEPTLAEVVNIMKSGFNQIGSRMSAMEDRMSGLEHTVGDLQSRQAAHFKDICFNLEMSKAHTSQLHQIEKNIESQNEKFDIMQNITHTLEQRLEETQSKIAKPTFAPGMISTLPRPHIPVASPPTEEKTTKPPPKVETATTTDPAIAEIQAAISKATQEGRYVGHVKHSPQRQARDSSDDRNRSPSPDPDHRRQRSKSPQGPRMQTFSGAPNTLKFDVFMGKFYRVANRRGWNQEKRLDRLFDCLTDQALEYANRSHACANFEALVADMAVRFDFRDEPLAARQKIAMVKQDTESEEEFLQTIQALANDGYRGERNTELLNRLTTEAFLRGLKNKEAALDALGRRPKSMQEALRYVKAFTANSKVLGVTKQVTFEQKAAMVIPDKSVKELSDSILQGIENLLKTHLEPRSRSPSPYRPDYNRAPGPYRPDYNRDAGRGRPQDRYRRSDRDYPYRRSPDRQGGSYDRRRSPSPRRDYGYSPQRSGYGPGRDRERERREDRNRSPRRDPYPRSDRGYSSSPERYRDYPDRYRYDSGTGQSRHKYQTRTTSPVPDEGDLNFEGLTSHATSG